MKSGAGAARCLPLIAAALAASCAPAMMKLPSGPGTPAADAADAFTEAVKTCRAVSTITAEIAVTGSVGGQRLRARLTAGLAPPASARIEAAAPFGAPFFILVASGGEATLVLPRDGRVLERGRPNEVLEALSGVPLDPAGLRLALTGCAQAREAGAGVRVGDDWRLVLDAGDEAYVHRESLSAPWRLVAVVHHPQAGDAWRAEYRDFDGGLPRTVRFVSNGRAFDLRLALSQVDTNGALGPDVFRVQVPPDAERITLDELKRSGPLGPARARETRDD